MAGDGSLYRRGRIWWLSYWVRGVQYRRSLRTDSLAEARRLKREELARIAALSGENPTGDLRTTYLQLRAALIERYERNGLRAGVLPVRLKHLDPFFSRHLAREIARAEVARYVESRAREGAANATINRELAALSTMFAAGIERGLITGAIRPWIARLRESNARKGFFERGEIDAVLGALPGHLRAPVMVAYITGWRIRSELLTRRREHLDLERGWLRLEPGETKNGEGRMFPVAGELRAVLEAQVEQTAALEARTGRRVEWLFHHNGKQIGSFRKAWATACRSAGLSGRILHDLRRTAVRNLERAGVPRSTAKRLTGHLTDAVYERYAIVDSAMLEEAAQRLSRYERAAAALAKPSQFRHNLPPAHGGGAEKVKQNQGRPLSSAGQSTGFLSLPKSTQHPNNQQNSGSGGLKFEQIASNSGEIENAADAVHHNSVTVDRYDLLAAYARLLGGMSTRPSGRGTGEVG